MRRGSRLHLNGSFAMTDSDRTPWTVQRVLRWAAEDFERRGLDSPRLDAELLLGHATGLDRIELILHAEKPLDADELERFRELIRRRRAGEPIAYVLGEREFYGMTFEVTADVLIPRPDTETLVEVALERTRERSLYGRLLDLCTGSGCVAVAFARHRPTWKVTGADVSERAIALARRNAARSGAIWGVGFVAGDLFEPVRGRRHECIAANPPYIPSGNIAGLMRDVRDFEPRLALDGGTDGLDFVRRIVEQSREHLTPGGLLALEVGYDQAARAGELFEASGFSELERARDYGGHERVVSGRLL